MLCIMLFRLLCLAVYSSTLGVIVQRGLLKLYLMFAIDKLLEITIDEMSKCPKNKYKVSLLIKHVLKA